MNLDWTVDLVGLHDTVDFLAEWWALFAVAPFFITPVLVFVTLRSRPHEKPPPGKRTWQPSRKRRSLPRRLFVDDSLGLRPDRKTAQLFAGTFFAAAMISILLFFGAATVMVVRGLLIANEREMGQ